MKAKLHSLVNRGESGGALLVSLVIMSVATVGVAAWVSIINGRTAYTEALETSMLRRVTLENSKALAEEYMYRTAASGVDGASASATLDGGSTANLQVPDWSGGAFASVVQPGGFNRLGMADGAGYVKYHDVALASGDDQVVRSFQLRSRSPIFSGDLVTLHRPTITPSTGLLLRGNIQVNGRTVLWRPDMLNFDNTYFRSKSYALLSRSYGGVNLLNLSGDRIRPSNFPFTPVSPGKTPGGSLGFDGRLSTVENFTTPENSLYHHLGDSPIVADGGIVSSNRGVISNGFGTISIDLNDPFLTNVFIRNETAKIILNGQSNASDFDEAGTRAAILIVFIQDGGTSRNLSQVLLTHGNNRRIAFAVKKTIDATGNSNNLRTEFRWMHAETNPSWRFVLIGENTDLLLSNENNGSVTMYGGIRADRQLMFHNNASNLLRIERETDPRLLDRLIDRNVWVESYAN